MPDLLLPDGLTLCEDGLCVPTWASHGRLLRDYYDRVAPVHDEVGVFEITRPRRLVQACRGALVLLQGNVMHSGRLQAFAP